MAHNYQRGDLCPVVFAPTGLGGFTLNIKGWNFDDESLLLDVSSTGSGGYTARIAGKTDARGTVTYDYDLDRAPYSTNIRIVSGVSGVILKYVSPITAIQYPIIIGKVHYESANESQVKGSFDWAMNVLAGAVLYPTAVAT